MRLGYAKAAAGAGLILALTPAARATVKPHGLFTDNCVLQREMKIPVWGTAGDGEKVTVSVAGKSASGVGQNGEFKVWIGPLKAGGPYTLTIKGQNTVEVKNVLVGEVWIGSGQSNMEWGLNNTVGGPEAVAGSSDKMLRLLTIPKATSFTPVKEVNQPWLESSPQTSPNFSAVAFYFGRELRKKLGVPVGLIHTSWGGTVAEAWTRKEVLETAPGVERLMPMYQQAKANYRAQLLGWGKQLAAYEEAAAKARAAGQPVPPAPQPPRDPFDRGNPNQPAVLYNAMIAPLIPYGIRGAIWYQGESNAGRAYEYKSLFPAMIQNWRDDWGQGDFPFYFVQLAPFQAIQKEPQEAAWPELRESQRLTSVNLRNTGQAVITDVGDVQDIHPRKKGPVGERLAYLALRDVYGKRIVGEGPTLDKLTVSGSKAVVHFKHVGGGLVAKDGPLTGFTIAGADKKWYLANAEIKGSTVVVNCPQVAKPVAVRFGWWNYPVVNLFNKEGIPASPFRTDDFPWTTQPK